MLSNNLSFFSICKNNISGYPPCRVFPREEIDVSKGPTRQFLRGLFFVRRGPWDSHAKKNEKFTKFSTPVVEGRLEGNVSQIFYLSPRFYLIKSRKLRCKKCLKVSSFWT